MIGCAYLLNPLIPGDEIMFLVFQFLHSNQFNSNWQNQKKLYRLPFSFYAQIFLAVDTVSKDNLQIGKNDFSQISKIKDDTEC